MKNLKTIKVFAMSFVLFLIIFSVLDYATLIVSRIRESAISINQMSIHRTLKEEVATSGEMVSKVFSTLSVGEGEYYYKGENTYYYPDAWNKPGRILLKRRCEDFYHIILGDGTIATVTFWYKRRDDPNVKSDYLHTDASKYMFGNFWVIPLGAMTIAITMVLVKRQGRRNKTELR